MKRRAFITLLGGAAVAWPIGTLAERGEHMRLVGVLMGYAANDPAGLARLAALHEGLEELGWLEGSNLKIETRFAGADPARIVDFSSELVGLRPDLIVANTAAVLAGLRNETRTIPLVFVLLNDPVGSGFVSSLARPGGNITGFSAYENMTSAKWLELLLAVQPRLTHALVLQSVANPNRAAYLPTMEAAARKSNVVLIAPELRDVSDIESAMDALTSDRVSGVIVLPGGFNAQHRKVILDRAARLRLPAVYPFSYYASEGGLMSYGVDGPDAFRRSASYVDRILKGANPGDLPVQLPVKFEFVFNLTTAKTLGLDVPPTLLATADKVIE